MTDIDPHLLFGVPVADMDALEARFWSKVAFGDWWDCWPWTSTCARGKGGKPYGQFKVNGRMRSAHRVAYELRVGPIADGLTIDHVHEWGCTNTLCCNPLHLDVVTIGENIRRFHQRKTHCKLGHPLVQGTYQRFCRICAREANRRYKERRDGRRSA